ncbi:MAG: DUF7483 domain-containing protein [Pseudobdellovibrionaceae bacterium]
MKNQTLSLLNKILKSPVGQFFPLSHFFSTEENGTLHLKTSELSFIKSAEEFLKNSEGNTVLNRRDFLRASAASFLGSMTLAKSAEAAGYYNVAMFRKGNSASQTYVDDVFSAYTFLGNNTNQNITTGINTLTNGGMIWIKPRDGVVNHALFDTATLSGSNPYYLSSNSTNGQSSFTDTAFRFLNNGFTAGNSQAGGFSAYNYISWTFRKAAKFFDVITWTGTGTMGDVSHAHSLGILPGMVLIKDTSAASNWYVWHRSTGDSNYMVFTTGATQVMTATYAWNITSSAITTRENGSTAFSLNTSGHTYVAYLFAHDTSANGLIQCGSYVGNGASPGPAINLGWEPQFVMVKSVSGGSMSGAEPDGWVTFDSARGMGISASSPNNPISLNSSAAEQSGANGNISPYSNGFYPGSTYGAVNRSGETFIYLAIRRPNKPPTSGTQVFEPVAYTGNATANTSLGTLQFPDAVFLRTYRTAIQSNTFGVFDRLRGDGSRVRTGLATGESTSTLWLQFGNKQVATLSTDSETNPSGVSCLAYLFRRAPGVLDIVAYTGNSNSAGGTQSLTHNLGVVPELIIVKGRDDASNGTWCVGANFGATTFDGNYLYTNNASNIGNTYTLMFGAKPTATTVVMTNKVAGSMNYDNLNSASINYVAYLFATKSGISKVGSYTGDGTTNGSKIISCGFTTGARFILIKRTDLAGDWLVWDTTRGINSSANDPHLSLNNTNAEVTTDDSIDLDNTGFKVKQNATTAINVNGATYIFLAIA